MSSLDPAQSTPEQRLEAVAPGYLAQVRRATEDLAAPSGSDQVSAWIGALEHLSIPVEAPVRSRRRGGRLVKVALTRALAHRTTQISDHLLATGRAFANLAAVLDQRTTQAEQEVRGAREELARLRERIVALERARR